MIMRMYAFQTYKFNHPEVKDDRVILGDIRNIVDHLDDYINKEIDVVVEVLHVRDLAQQISKE